MLNKKGEVLYVGKARSLKKRVRSYFSKGPSRSASTSPYKQFLLEEIADIKYIQTKSELEALILECNFIKRHRPRYNIELKDDKSYPYIRIDKGRNFPSIRLVRFPRGIEEEKRDAWFFGPYPKLGLIKQALKTIRRIFPLRSCARNLDEGKIYTACLNYHLHLCPGPCQGKVKKETYWEAVRKTLLLLKGKNRQLARQLKRKMRMEAANLAFEEAAKTRNQLAGLQEIIDLGEKCSFPALSHLVEGKGEVLKQLKQIAHLPYVPHIIEAFDVSNIGGEFATGSMVSFKEGEPFKDGYRHFKIRTVGGINDIEMLAEIVRRRYVRLLQEKARPAHLILVDGGKAQLHASFAALEELHLNIPLLSLAKRLEEVYQISPSGRIKKLCLPLTSPVLHLLQHIRDEAHRFALKYHRILRSDETKKSSLDEIKGIGRNRRQRLLAHFRSLEEIRQASMEELIGLGIPRNLAAGLKSKI